MRRKILGGILAGAVFGGVAVADTIPGSSGDFDITANVLPNCEILSGIPDQTVPYDPFVNTDTDIQYTGFSFRCVTGTSVSIYTESQNNPGGNFGHLVNTSDPSEILQYRVSLTVAYPTGPVVTEGNLFQNPLTFVAPNPNPPAITIETVIIAANQNVAAGTYTDTVTLNIQY
ncbi:MAG TPA: hypothetical protein ENK22_06020 [Persephonella sp.]|nr:hypothetical protein [Persephonella sp.]